MDERLQQQRWAAQQLWDRQHQQRVPMVSNIQLQIVPPAPQVLVTSNAPVPAMQFPRVNNRTLDHVPEARLPHVNCHNLVGQDVLNEVAWMHPQHYPENRVVPPPQPDTAHPFPASQVRQVSNGAALVAPPSQDVVNEVACMVSQQCPNQPGSQNRLQPRPTQPDKTQTKKRKDAPTSPSQPTKKRIIIDLTRDEPPKPSRSVRQVPNHGFGPSTTILPSTPCSPKPQKHKKVTAAHIHEHAKRHGVKPSSVEIKNNIRLQLNAWLMHQDDLHRAKSLLDPSPEHFAHLVAHFQRAAREQARRDAAAGDKCEYGFVPEALTAAAKARVANGEFDFSWSQGDVEKLEPVRVEALDACMKEGDAWRPMEEVGISEERACLLWGLEGLEMGIQEEAEDDGVEEAEAE